MLKKLQLSLSAILLSFGMIACGQSSGELAGDSNTSFNQESIFGEWVLVAVDNKAVDSPYGARLIVMEPTALSGGQGCSSALLAAPDDGGLYLVDQSDQTCFLEFSNDDPRLPLVSDLNQGSPYYNYNKFKFDNGTMTLQGHFDYLFKRK